MFEFFFLNVILFISMILSSDAEKLLKNLQKTFVFTFVLYYIVRCICSHTFGRHILYTCDLAWGEGWRKNRLNKLLGCDKFGS